jgi:phage baseplate assembly protein W|tara:strand:- start:3876 stop:4271 length:396 start_codon:yes stop_codon:yes gene_type:complete
MAGLSPKLPLHRNFEDGYALNKTFKDLTRQNLKMLILTSPGERLMFPLFGVGLRRYLFRNADATTFSEIRNKINSQVRRYMPYVSIESVDFLSESTSTSIIEGTSPGNFVHLQIKYSIPDSFLSDTLSVRI